MNNLPILAITMGDPAGVGPEIIAMSLAQEYPYTVCRPVVIGDAKMMEKGIASAKVALQVRPIEQVSQAQYERGVIDVLDLNLIDPATFAYGEVQAQCGHAAFEAVRTAIELAMKGEVDGTVTAPLNKEALHVAGHNFAGHTEIYAHYTDTKKYAMLLADDKMRVIHVSTHVSLREACDRAKKERVIAVTELIREACLSFGIEDPRIGIAGLNPHAGEGGLFGDEEIREIIPAIEEMKQKGWNVDGPVPPDSLFSRARSGQFDGCVAMYHDQGHIAFKVGGFEWDRETQRMVAVKGVNITLGLPIIRVSVDHGTAFDVAGKGIANPDALLMSIEYAALMAKNRKK